VSAMPIGETFAIGETACVVLAVEHVHQVGLPDLAPFNAPAGSTIVLVSYALRNEGASARTWDSTNFVVKDSRGREFRSDMQVQAQIDLNNPNNIQVGHQLQPGVDYNGVVAFLVPDDALDEHLVIQFQGGMFDTWVDARLSDAPLSEVEDEDDADLVAPNTNLIKYVWDRPLLAILVLGGMGWLCGGGIEWFNDYLESREYPKATTCQGAIAEDEQVGLAYGVYLGQLGKHPDKTMDLVESRARRVHDNCVKLCGADKCGNAPRSWRDATPGR
jgi:hypothetical protein